MGSAAPLARSTPARPAGRVLVVGSGGMLGRATMSLLRDLGADFSGTDIPHFDFTRPDSIRAVVSRGGRPDLAGRALGDVQAPTLLIVGGADTEVLELNRRALHELRCEKRLSVVPGATHLFEEPGALEEVARLASAWLLRFVPVEEPVVASGARAR